MPAISHVEVCYGSGHSTDGYHSLSLEPHGIDVDVTLRWLLDGEEAPEVLTDSQIQQREIARQVGLRRIVAVPFNQGSTPKCAPTIDGSPKRNECPKRNELAARLCCN